MRTLLAERSRSGLRPSLCEEISVVSYAHRGGRMTAGQLQAWHRWWPEYGLDFEKAPRPLDVPAWFGRTAPLVMEIGSGMGESTAALAAAAPELSHLAVEIYPPGLAALLIKLRAAGLENLRLLRGDAVDVLAELVEPDSLAGMRIFFPDPWPKRKHHKRRLIQPDFVALAASRLRQGATLHLATDWEPYAAQMREVCGAERLLVTGSPEAGDGWLPRPPWRPLTKFEERAAAEGRIVRDLLYHRVTIG